jgi:hypothetical protein
MFRTFVLILAVGASTLLSACSSDNTAPSAPLSTKASSPSEVTFPGADGFVSEITNPYLNFGVGTTFRYEGETPDGHETIVTEVTHKTKRIMGVICTVVHDQGYLDGELAEDTFDWYAQDMNGNVWYFGEDSKEIEDGEVVSTEGSWQAGVNGAQPGIIMLANPLKGDSYQQEFAEDVAEDMARVVSLSEAVTVPYGSFTGCLETLEWTPLEPGAREYKFYSAGTGQILELGKHGERIELVSITN